MQLETSADPSKPLVRLAVACGFCYKSTVSLGKNDPMIFRRPQMPGGIAASPPSPVSPSITKSAIAKSDVCMCRKPRPRCSFCFSRLNTPSSLQMFQPSFKIDQNDQGQPVIKRVNHPFGAFTVFCMTCRHSGHATHYLNWFKTNSTCPVSGCTCSCSSLDKSAKLQYS